MAFLAFFTIMSTMNGSPFSNVLQQAHWQWGLEGCHKGLGGFTCQTAMQVS